MQRWFTGFYEVLESFASGTFIRYERPLFTKVQMVLSKTSTVLDFCNEGDAFEVRWSTGDLVEPIYIALDEEVCQF